MNNELPALGAQIRRLRRELSISQEELARRSTLHRTYLSDLERGSRNPSFLSLLALARGLGLNISELVSNLDVDSPSLLSKPEPEDCDGRTWRPKEYTFPGPLVAALKGE
jgi:transcriptional regulator with XRE-family HTH domain